MCVLLSIRYQKLVSPHVHWSMLPILLMIDDWNHESVASSLQLLSYLRSHVMIQKASSWTSVHSVWFTNSRSLGAGMGTYLLKAKLSIKTLTFYWSTMLFQRLILVIVWPSLNASIRIYLTILRSLINHFLTRKPLRQFCIVVNKAKGWAILSIHNFSRVLILK